ncbi:MAG: hemerythrin [Candidatus Magnetoglobus multicellularis str. Araruama]|uniref:Hemerythrin n=1 Tax=Candidatus Magnetoglobus multicellularis str. Araruama TaxID=890399 RepID=A0A1V1PF31_9BACT|nr:MAG: hemerythrin [Candidatus Magnetoglobus multicellularis str. Araruama]
MTKIGKIQVTKGVFWVEIPDENIYVLCGCPADSVKHMKNRGLIVTREEKGVTFETGPNVILLSDVMLQNGGFANMAEFPVLQMLYFQGMILPNHPNNTGVKPMLIGSENQVEAQMQYIYRGNYGLISESEILDAGMSPEKTKDMMRLKLKFAFGAIRNTEALLDSRVISNDLIEIRNNVFVRRLQLNVFEFQYKDETVTVDLNLKPHETYGASYTLDFHHIKREYFAVLHSGQGDGWDVNRPTMSSILMFQGKIYLIDTGPNILYSLKALGIGVNEIEGIFHTHAHDDHFSGLTSLMHTDHRIKYFATALVRASVTKKLSALVSMEEEDFANYFDIHDLEFDTWNNIESLEVKPLFSPHPVETSILIFRALGKDGYKTYGHFADIVSLNVLKNMITDDPDANGISQQWYDDVCSHYLEPLNIKKIDIGGGLIHGVAEDFGNDSSDKIILSHTSKELTNRQKEIGSGAPFGMVDVLIPSHQDYVRRFALHFLQSYFPKAPMDQLRMLLNSPMILFNPESIVIKGDMLNENIYLVLTGEVEVIHTPTEGYSLLSAGGLIGEISGLSQEKSKETYRAINFVQALEIPCSLYLDFVKRNGLYAEIERIKENREFLQNSWLFGEGIAYPTLNMIAQEIEVAQYIKDHEIVLENNQDIYMLKSGRIERLLDEQVYETLSAGNIIGEERVLFGTSSVFKSKVIQDSIFFKIPGKVLLNIPIVRWKLFEIYDKRMKSLINPKITNSPMFSWRDEYAVHENNMDNDHKYLLEKANDLYQLIDANNKQDFLKTMDEMIAFAQRHFKDEEALMKEKSFPEYRMHHKKHKRILRETLEVRNKIEDSRLDIAVDFVNFLKDWVINHILTEDRKYGEFLAREMESDQ